MSGLRLRYRISLAVIAIMLVGCMFLGSSYALWKVEFEQAQENVIKTGCFDILFEDTNGSESINLDKAYPISDQKGLGNTNTPYTFTIKNECTIDANYKLYLNVLKITTNGATDKNQKISGQIPDGKIKYSLVKGETSTHSVANTIDTLKENKETTSFDLEGKELTKSYILDEGDSSAYLLLKSGESQQYSLKLWISDKAETDINYYRFEAQLATIAYAVNTPGEDVNP